MAKNVSPVIKAGILFFYLAVLMVVTSLGGDGDLGKIDLTNPTMVMVLKITQVISVIFLFIAPTLFFVFFTSEKRLRYLKLNTFNLAAGVATVTLVLTVMPFINWVGEINSYLSLPEFLSGVEQWMKAKEETLKELTGIFLQMNGIGDLIINLIVVALFAAVGEELLFRGAIQNVLVEWTNKKHLSVWITAILFSALHVQFYGFLPRMLLGVVLGYLYIWSGSLWLSVLFHFLNNGMAVVFAYLVSKGSLPEEAETIGSQGTPIYYVMVSVLLSAGLMGIIYRNRPSPYLPKGESV